MSPPAPTPDDRTQYERMLAGDPYLADEPRIVAEHQRAVVLLDRYNRDPAAPYPDRRQLLEELLGAFGADSELRPPFYCDFGGRMFVGARTFANFGLVALDVAPIVIGDDVQIGPSVQLLTPTHPIDPEARQAKWESARPISIGDNVWLGGGVIVLPGVSIGRNSVIGAGSVVSRDVPADVVALGNPARVTRQVSDSRDP